MFTANNELLEEMRECINPEVTECSLQLKGYLQMKLTHTPVFVASQRQESWVKFVSRLIGGQVLDLRSQTWSEHNLYEIIACNFENKQNQTRCSKQRDELLLFFLNLL